MAVQYDKDINTGIKSSGVRQEKVYKWHLGKMRRQGFTALTVRTHACLFTVSQILACPSSAFLTLGTERYQSSWSQA